MIPPNIKEAMLFSELLHSTEKTVFIVRVDQTVRFTSLSPHKALAFALGFIVQEDWVAPDFPKDNVIQVLLRWLHSEKENAVRNDFFIRTPDDKKSLTISCHTLR